MSVGPAIGGRGSEVGADTRQSPSTSPDPQPSTLTPGILSTALLIARKDLAIEFRTRSAFFSAVVFALLAPVIRRDVPKQYASLKAVCER